MDQIRYEDICNQAKLLRRKMGTDRDIEGAKVLYNEAISMDPTNGKAIEGLAICYEIEGDYARAKELYEEALAAGTIDAEANIGQMYLNGWGVEKDIEKGVSLIERATDSGSGYGAYLMSLFHQYGDFGFNESKEKDFEYSLKSANAGYPRGYALLGRCYEFGIGCEVDIDKAKDAFRKGMELLDGDSALRLSRIYRNTTYAEVDIDKSIECLFRAAELCEKDAMLLLVYRYSDGEGVPYSLDEAEKWAMKAAEYGDCHGIVYLYDKFERKDEPFYNPQKSFELKKIASDKGDPIAIYDLGEAYMKGIGVNVNKEEGIRLLQEAADKKRGAAFYSLGMAYANGDGVEQDMSKAIEYFKGGAEVGYLPACNLLYNEALEGVFSNRDDRDELILTYLNKAVELGGIDATIDLAFFKIGGNRLFEKNVDEGIELLERVAAEDNVKSIRSLAGVYFTEEYGRRDINKALMYYEKAANLNDTSAMVMLGDIYKDGDEDGIEQDLNKAAEYYRKAYEAGDVKGAINLGDMWVHGVITVGEGMDLLEWSVNKGSALAMAKLANMLENGIGEVNIPRAIELYNKAKEDESINADYINEKLAKLYKSLGDEESINALIDLAAQECPEAQYEVAGYFMDIYYNQDGGDEFEQKAIEYYRKAAASGHIMSQILLGTIYLPFSENPQDVQVAIQYLENGVRVGHPGATYMYLEMMSGNGNRNYPGDKNRAISFLSMLSDENNVDAQHTLATIYDGCGAGGYEDYINKREAINQYTRAANNGHIDAMCDLAISYINGDGTSPDYYIGKSWFERAADLGSARAKYSLGVHLASGKNEPKNIPLAKHYLEQATNIDPQGEESRYIGLSYLHLGAIAVDDERNYNLAKEYINKAIKSGTLSDDSVQHAKDMLARIN